MTMVGDRQRMTAAWAVWAELLLLAGVFLTPYVTWRIVPDILLTVSDVLFVAALLLLLAAGRLTLLPFGGLTPIWIGALALMLFGLLIASVINDAPSRWMIVAAQYVVSFGILPMILASGSERQIVARLKALVLGVTAMEAFGGLTYWWLEGSYLRAIRISPDFITGMHRLGAFMADANWNAAMIAATFPVLAYLGRTGRMGGALGGVCLVVLCIGLLLCGSVSGLVSSVLGMATFFLFAGGRRAVRPVIGGLLLIVAAWQAGVELPSAFQIRVAGALETGDVTQAGTFLGRLELIEEAWRIVDTSGWVGLGADRFRVISEEQAPVHNMLLLIWAEGGLMGLTGWLLLTLLPLVLAAMALHRDRLKAAVCAGTAIPFITFSMSAAHMYARCWTVPLLLTMALVMTSRSRPGIHPRKLSRRGRYPSRRTTAPSVAAA